MGYSKDFFKIEIVMAQETAGFPHHKGDYTVTAAFHINILQLNLNIQTQWDYVS